MKKIVATLLILIAVAVVVVSLVTGILFMRTSGDYTVAKTLAQDKTIPHIEIKGYPFHSETYGDRKNPTIVAIHGGPGNDYRYILPLKALSDEYFVVFYDQRGAGLSPRVPEDQLTMESYLEDLDDVIGYYAGEEPVIIIGHSWGAMLTTAYLAKHPNRVSKAVLAEPGVLTNESAEVYLKEIFRFPGLPFLLHFYKSWIKSFHVSGPDEYAARDFFYTEALMNYEGPGGPMARYYCNEKAPRHALKDWRFGAVASGAVRKMAKDEEGNIRMNLAEGVHRYKNKVLLIASECNQLIGVEYQKKYHLKLFADAELKVIRNSGHAMFGERPEESLRVIRAYLKSSD
jgi:proline iminopeptidase